MRQKLAEDDLRLEKRPLAVSYTHSTNNVLIGPEHFQSFQLKAVERW